MPTPPELTEYQTGEPAAQVAVKTAVFPEQIVGLFVPVGFVGGTESVECRQAGLVATKKLVGKHFVKIQGGHLIPMEVPMQTAQAVHEMICSFNLKEVL